MSTCISFYNVISQSIIPLEGNSEQSLHSKQSFSLFLFLSLSLLLYPFSESRHWGRVCCCFCCYAVTVSGIDDAAAAVAVADDNNDDQRLFVKQ